MTLPKEITSARLDVESVPGGRKTDGAFAASFDVSRVPTGPGCYLMLNAKERPIYVGKAKNLRARIRCYLNESDSRYSVKFLMRRVAHIDFLLTANEKEALLLENSLIKQHKPRYNVRLKDDKTFISLRLDTREAFPRIAVVRRYKRDGAKYFGPYHSALAVRQVLRQIQRLFPLRTCTDHVMNNRARPCLYYQMKQCVAPCVDYVNREDYHALVQQVVMVLEGKSAQLEIFLKDRIQAHADRLEFEAAAVLRDRLYALRGMMERQRTVGVAGHEDRDVFAVYGEGPYTSIQVLFYRGGKMLGGRNVSFEHREMPLDELLSSFLLQYYAEAPSIPAEVLVPVPLEDSETLGEVLSDQRGTKVRVHCPQRGDKRALIALAEKNARRGFEEKRLAERADGAVLEDLRDVLKLPEAPERIECFDISTMQGTNTVASMVTFTRGRPDKARYRRFSIKTVEGQDDFAAMREVLLRRYTRAIEEDDLPGLVLIDGGKGQLGVATAVFKDLGIEDLPHAGIAKARTEAGRRSPERFFIPGRANPIIPRQDSPVVHLAERIRDEAHRFAVRYHRERRNRATLSTVLTGIPGIGRARARTLLIKLGSVAKIRAARMEDIAALPGFNTRLAQTVHDHLREN